MKNLKTKGLTMIAALLICFNAAAQTTELRLEVKGVKEAKGNILIAVKSCDDPQQTVFEMVPVTEKGTVICLLKNLPLGKVDLSLFHDLNENYQLDTDEQKIPIEPCYQQEKLKLKEDGNTIKVTLINVKEMMGGMPE